MERCRVCRSLLTERIDIAIGLCALHSFRDPYRKPEPVEHDTIADSDGDDGA
ncbi:hypothetical protein [Novosphingobium naphthalenivorans]|uniref:hypothetical protein n=1 Tax=Novosphingobium naphthalenivorans TaxID=273168 RepID=UPI000A9D476C|nr:hypothetical protein [Novosphingobium naphthalenivorans]